MEHIFKSFDEEEASHGAVCIQEVPGQSPILEYNRRKAAGDPLLAPVVETTMAYGSIGSSHINQVLRNVLHGAGSKLVMEACDEEGRLSMKLIAAHDAALAASCKQGLRWEVLSHKLQLEEPTGISVIQAAMNDRGSAQMLQHEMQMLKLLANICSKESQAAQGVAVETVRSLLRSQGASALAEAPFFLGMFSFVVEHGADDSSGMLQALFTFHEKFVNPKMRRLREYHFRVVCSLPRPWLRLALIQAAYACPVGKIRDGWIDYFGGGQIASLMRTEVKEALDFGDELMRRFHCVYRKDSVWSHLPAGQDIQILGKLGIDIGNCLLGKVEKVSLPALKRIAAKHEASIRSKLPPVALKDMPDSLGGDVSALADTPAEAKIVATPKIITFDADGKAVGSQVELEEEVVDVVVPPTDLPSAADFQTEIAKARLFSALSDAYSMYRVACPVEIRGDPKRPASLRVVATQFIAEGKLLLLPMVPSSASI